MYKWYNKKFKKNIVLIIIIIEYTTIYDNIAIKKIIVILML